MFGCNLFFEILLKSTSRKVNKKTKQAKPRSNLKLIKKPSCWRKTCMYRSSYIEILYRNFLQKVNKLIFSQK